MFCSEKNDFKSAAIIEDTPEGNSTRNSENYNLYRSINQNEIPLTIESVNFEHQKKIDCKINK